MNEKNLNEILEKIAFLYDTDLDKVKSEIEKTANYNELTNQMSWDEIITYFTCLTLVKGGYKDIFE